MKFVIALILLLSFAGCAGDGGFEARYLSNESPVKQSGPQD